MKPKLLTTHLLLLVAISLFISGPLVFLGIPDISHDGINHAHWQSSFARQLWQGEFYPRWLPDHNAGYGSPTYFFYPSLPSYASAIFFPLVHVRDPDGWMQAGYACALPILLSAIAAYLWLRSLTPPTAAFFGAIIYVACPYHIAVDLYLRGACAELWGFALLPVLMLFAGQLCKRTGIAFLGLAASFALLLMAHLPTVACFSIVLPAWAFWTSKPGERIQRAALAILAMILGAGLAAIYLAPAIFDQQKSKIISFFASSYNYRQYWLFHKFSWPPDFDSVLVLTNVSTLAFSGAMCVLCLRRKTTPKERRAVMFFITLSVYGLYFMTRFSAPIWRIIPMFSQILFPWRFSTLLVLAAAALSALGFSKLRYGGNRWLKFCLILPVVCWLAVEGLAIRRGYSAFRGSHDSTNRELVKSRVDTCEYWPAAALRDQQCVEIVPVRLRLLTALQKQRPAKSLTLNSTVSGRSHGSAAVLDWRPRRVEMRIDVPEPTRLTVAHFFYPDWRAHIDGHSDRILVVPSNPQGLMQLQLPSGRYELILELIRGRAERLGMLISVCAVVLWLAVFWLVAVRRKASHGTIADGPITNLELANVELLTSPKQQQAKQNNPQKIQVVPENRNAVGDDARFH
ncbi:MAG TPA: 6-pyruvoyl-tetrahydropterin synthase-related protein [Bryobacteraceae bacterium]|nr:6-pyruvoyl-tetrahydropterin synthase-related protein [Bryobacteraceae bacterium]